MHLIVILGILLVIFGPSKLPELGAGIGRGIKEFKKSLSHDEKLQSEEDNKTQSSDVTRE